MRYLCLVYETRGAMQALPKAKMESLQKEGAPHVEELQKSGHLMSVSGLTGEASTIRPRNRKPSVTDGPFS